MLHLPIYKTIRVVQSGWDDSKTHTSETHIYRQMRENIIKLAWNHKNDAVYIFSFIYLFYLFICFIYLFILFVYFIYSFIYLFVYLFIFAKW